MVLDDGPEADVAVSADFGATADDGMCRDERVRSDTSIVTDMNSVVDLHAGHDASVPDSSPVDGDVTADFHILPKLDTADMGEPGPEMPWSVHAHPPETVTTDDGSHPYPDWLARDVGGAAALAGNR